MSNQTVLLLIFVFYYYQFSLTTAQATHCGEYGFRCVNQREYEICDQSLSLSEQESNNTDTHLIITRSCLEDMRCDEENPAYCSPPETDATRCDSSKDKRYVDFRSNSKRNDDDYKTEDDPTEIYHEHDDINLNFMDVEDGINEWEFETQISSSTTETPEAFCKSFDMDIARMFSNPHDCERIGYFPGKFKLFLLTNIFHGMSRPTL